MKNLVKLGIFFLILILGFGFLAFYWTFYKPLPDYSSTHTIPGLQNEVDIFWDTNGVPHIYAENEDDLYFTMGYVHAQDRLWQMTLSQIAAEGRFAEFFGEDLIEFDRYQRTLGFWKTAQRIEQEVLNDKDRAILEAYSKGVNTFIDENQNRLPVEFALTGMQPIRWNPTRTIAVARLMGWELNMGWWSEVMYNYLQEHLPADKFAELRLRFPNDAPTTLNDEESLKLSANLMPLLNTEIELRKKLNKSGSHVGSNAWVVDGSKTESGYPLLAGDPHLGLDMPGKWYEVHMNVNDKNVSGVTIAGIPVVILGQNDHMAWTFTNVMADDTDFFLEKQDPNDRSRYVADSLQDSTAVYEPFVVEREIIKVKDGNERVHEIRYTKHGPIISDIYPNQTLIDDYVVSMKWTGHELSNELRTLYGINWATSFQEFKDALPHFGVAGQNVMYGDKARNIAMYSLAKIPIRNNDPITFRRGWEPEDDWQGFVPFEQMPSVINPEKGWIANANNKLYTDSYPYYLATFWEPPSRIERIEDILTSDSVFTVEDFKELQNDSYSTFAFKNTQTILEILRGQNEYSFPSAIAYLENWDYKYESSATAASIFDSFFLSFTKNTLEDEFGKDVFSAFLHHENIPVRTLSQLLQTESAFFDNVNTPQVETKQDIVIKSMQDALYFLSDSLGQEEFEWRWEQLHTLTLAPPLFSQAAEDPDAPGALKLIVDNLMSKGPYPVKGHGMSVNNGQYNWEKPFEMVLGASVRRIVDLSNLSSSLSVLPTGQSGNPLSDHYGDQTQLWLDGKYKDLVQDSALFTETSMKKMRLKPEK